MARLGSLNIEKLGLNNWGVWNVQMMSALRAMKLWPLGSEGVKSEGTRTRSSDSSDEAAVARSEEALGVIGMYVEKHLLRDVKEATSAGALWQHFEEMFAAKDDPSRLLVLRQQLNSLQKKSDEAMALYLSRSKDLMAELKAVGSGTTETEVVLSVLRGLPAAYKTAVEVLQMSDALSFQKVVPRLLQVEQLVQQEYPELDVIPVYGAHAQGARRCFKCDKPGNVKSRCPPPKCDYCRKMGHSDMVCHTRARDFKQKQQGFPAYSATVQSPECYYCNKKGHWKSECPVRPKQYVAAYI